MPTELEELVEFLHHGNTQIRQIAAENLVPYTTAQPSLFKRNQLEPIRDLKLLIKDYAPIAKNATLMLVNLTEDTEIVKLLIEDDAFLESLLRRITDSTDPNINEQTMLLANLAKSPLIIKLLTLKRPHCPSTLSSSPLAIDQLLDCFVKGAGGSYNKHGDYDYLSYLFADLAKHGEARTHFLTPRADDSNIVPLTKLIVFTEHKSTIRRRGVANTIKNVAFQVDAHKNLLADADASTGDGDGDRGIGLLPYILLPLMGSEEYADDDTEGMLDEVQLLPPDKEREKQGDITSTHLETLLLLTTTREGRERLRSVQVYPIVRELHLQIEDEGVKEGCDRLVQVLMRDEEGEGQDGVEPPRVEEVVEEEDEDDQVVDVL